MYIWQDPQWPHFTFCMDSLVHALADVRSAQAYLQDRTAALGLALRDDATLLTLTNDIVQSSAIEGESLPPASVRSSLAYRLGLDAGGLLPADRHVDGMVDVMLDAVQRWDAPLTAERVCAWHGALFPTGRSGLYNIRVGQWRDDAKGAMRVVSGRVDKERVHYVAPPAAVLPSMLDAFFTWFNADTKTDAILKAGLAHVYFVTLHPFDDGNGRLARAIGDMALSRADNGQHFYSLSVQIQKERAAYYTVLEHTQKGTLDVTSWLAWFLDNLAHAVRSAHDTLEQVLFRARAWETWAGLTMNPRQKHMCHLLLGDFVGKCTLSKWAKITNVSQDTAQNDINQLLEWNVLARQGQSRSTSYVLAPLAL